MTTSDRTALARRRALAGASSARPSAVRAWATWTAAFLVSVGLSMALLELAARSIPMGTAYAVWGGIGAVGTVLVGIAFFGEPAGLVRALLILVIVAAIAGLRITA